MCNVSGCGYVVAAGGDIRVLSVTAKASSETPTMNSDGKRSAQGD